MRSAGLIQCTTLQRTTLRYNLGRSWRWTRTISESRTSELPSEPPTNASDLSQTTHLRTLRPERLTSYDYRDWGGKRTVNAVDIPGVRNAVHFRSAHTLLPVNTRGFLYYFQPPFAPFYAGQLRFRITSSSDPSSFHSGSDYKDKTGLPWNVNMAAIAANPAYKPLASVLLSEGLVSESDFTSLVQVAEETLSRTPHLAWWQSVLYAYGQPFWFGFGNTKRRLMTIGYEKDALAIRYLSICSPGSSHTRKDDLPFSGSGICCMQHAPDKDVAYIKLLKVLEPINLKVTNNTSARYRTTMPREGEYIRMYHGELQQVAFDSGLRTRNAQALRLLQEYPDVTYDMF